VTLSGEPFGENVTWERVHLAGSLSVEDIPVSSAGRDVGAPRTFQGVCHAALRRPRQ
jgi:hypothetical protein